MHAFSYSPLLAKITPTLLCASDEWAGDSSIALRKCSIARSVFPSLSNTNPRFVWAYDNKGIVLGRMSQFEEAVQAFDSAIKYNPNFIKAYSAKALALSKLGLYREALDSINIVINKKHGSAYDYSIRATSLFGLKKLEEANKAIDQAILLESDSAKVSNYFYNKALILKDLGRIQEAIEACNKSLKYNQSNHNTTNLKKDLEKK